MLYKRDGAGRIIAVGLYGDGVTFLASDDPVSKDDYRIGLIEAAYDERGRPCRVTRHQIDESDGSIVSGGDLTYSYWFDPVGRLIKQDANELLKIRYDGLGREYQRFFLASDDDGSTYSNVYSASDRRTKADGDVVLEEYQTGFNKQTGDAVVTAVIKRFHTDTGTSLTGPLDVTYESGGDADALKFTAADVKGRIQITARWFDFLHRQTTVATYGTYGGSTFDRAGLAEPSTSTSDRLVVTYAYDSAGALASVLDAKRQNTTVYQYDDAGRQTAVIENHTDGSPGGGSDDDQDRTTKYVYAYPSSGPGLIRQIIADRSGTSDDQVTTYTYGTNKVDTGMEIGTGHLLRTITYPDAGSGEPPVSLIYNINRRVKQITDQTKASSGSNENVINITYDAQGREATRTAHTTHSSFDAAVKTIETGYDAHGRIQRVTQKDASTAILDEVKFTYDRWGQLIKFEQDMDSAVGASGGIPTRSVEYVYAKATGGRNTLRGEELTYPDGSAIAFNYLSTSGRHDDNASRVSRIDITGSSAVSIASYEYLGAGTVVGTDILEPATFLRRYGSGSGNYDKLDRLDRVVTDTWQRTGASATATFYEAALTYDENHNPTLVNDNFHKTQFDAHYTIDKLNRLQRAQEGEWGGSSFSATLRDEQWDLGGTGNWTVHKWDRNGDGSFTGTGELNENNPDTGSSPNFNKANEILGRNTDNSGGNEYTLTHDAVGNLTDDGKDYTYKYDIFGRLREVRSRGSGTPLVAEYRYNGLGYLIAEHVDVTDSSGGAPDGTVDSYDPWYYRYHDERWRTVMVYRGTTSSTDSSPKERFIYHAAGDDGTGPSSYIDDLICRDRDNTNGVAGAADGTMEERRYLFQNYRHDVIAVLTDVGIQVETVRYTSYGMPFCIGAADLDCSGGITANDYLLMMNAGSTYDARGDFDLSGAIIASDYIQFMNEAANGFQLGFGKLSRPDTLNRSGYAGYWWDQAIARYHVRNRAYDPSTGRWLTRDPIGYAFGLGLYEYATSGPGGATDSWGLGPDDPPSTIRPPGLPLPPGVKQPPYRLKPGDTMEQQLKKMNDAWFDPDETRRCEVQCATPRDKLKHDNPGYAATVNLATNVGETGVQVIVSCCPVPTPNEAALAALGAGSRMPKGPGGGIAKSPANPTKTPSTSVPPSGIEPPPGGPKPPSPSGTQPQLPSRQITDPSRLLPEGGWPPSRDVTPPFWNPNWKRGADTNAGYPRYTDPSGGQWRCHTPDDWHKTWHWDYQAPGKNQPWINVDPKGIPLPGQEHKFPMLPHK